MATASAMLRSSRRPVADDLVVFRVILAYLLQSLGHRAQCPLVGW
jgi:hypothetical protein